jgi:hypothetical protein
VSVSGPDELGFIFPTSKRDESTQLLMPLAHIQRSGQRGANAAFSITPAYRNPPERLDAIAQA